MCRILPNKKAQVGTTITWIFATIVIISILGITFFVADFSFGKSKDFRQTNQADILASKSFFSYLLTNKTYSQLKTEGDLNDFNGNLALDIFEEFYGKEYAKVWVGIRFNVIVFSYKPNDYFGRAPSPFTGDNIGGGLIPHLREKINLNEEKSVELVFRRNIRKII